MEPGPTVVLVHGAFSDASGYAGVIRRLQSRGVEVRAPMNPLRGLAFDASAIARYVTAVKGPVVLVGHSYGGAVISQAAPLVSGVTALVFLSAFALDQGESCASIQEPFPGPRLASAIVPSAYDGPGGPDLFISIPEFHQAFCADLPANLASVMAVSQRPVSAAALTETATAAGWKELPSWYLVSGRDNILQPDCQRYLARRMNATVEPVGKGSHAAFIARPDIAAGLILKAIEVTGGK